MAEAVTLDEYLERNEGSLKYKLLDGFVRWTPKDYPGSVVVRWRASYAAGTELICDLPVKEKPVSVMQLIEEIRRKIHDHWKGAPLLEGVLDTRVAKRGEKDSPDFTHIRRICPPASEQNQEVAYLRSELLHYRSWCQFLMTELTKANGNSQSLIGQLTSNLQALATTRAATTSMADVSPIQLMVGMIVLPVMLPRINKLLGLKGEASIDKTLTRVQALGSAGLERLLGEVGVVDEPPAPQRESRTVSQLAEDAPANEAVVEAVVEAELVERDAGAAEAEPPAPRVSPATPAPSAAAWPKAADLVAHLAEDDDYLDEVVTALLSNPAAAAALQQKLAPFKAMFGG